VNRDRLSIIVRAEPFDVAQESLVEACAHSDMPFDRLRANGNFVMCNGKLK
jgi:hypothetical protein